MDEALIPYLIGGLILAVVVVGLYIGILNRRRRDRTSQALPLTDPRRSRKRSPNRRSACSAYLPEPLR
jgi:hypothetical protein